MPKNEIDYSTTIIYKITCNDPNINDIYVGHTTNFVQRKHAHKASCINEKSSNYKCKLYETIRCNGGWSNWKMEIINFFNCANHYEARIKEQEYFTLLNANLNSIEPLPKPKINIKSIQILEKKEKSTFYCQTCNVYLQNFQLLEIHKNTKKHIKLCNSTNLIEKKTVKFMCEKCDFFSDNKNDLKQHLHTIKHTVTENQPISTLVNENPKFKCVCGKIYKDKSGIWRHNKKCQGIKEPIEEVLEKHSEKQSNKEEPTINEIIEILKAQVIENQELRKLMIEQYKQIMDTASKSGI
uniref:C2H2-type domain-containing protein n=1 Tax=viral metagenome TaxID=1070528 RepID=A0A6C0IAE4_9ZZZZ